MNNLHLFPDLMLKGVANASIRELYWVNMESTLLVVGFLTIENTNHPRRKPGHICS